MTLKPEATSMLSLFRVLVCVLAQLSNNAVHAAIIVASKICVGDFISLNLVVDNKRNASEGNSSGDLRAVPDNVETKIVFLEVTGKCPITNLSKDGTGEVDTEHALDLPH
jgi:hypothetical protein